MFLNSRELEQSSCDHVEGGLVWSKRLDLERQIGLDTTRWSFGLAGSFGFLHEQPQGVIDLVVCYTAR